MTTVGIVRQPHDFLLDYLGKLNTGERHHVRSDRRQWPNGENGIVTRPVATWEEAHKLVVEYEKLNKEDRVIAVGMMPLDGGIPVLPKGAKAPAGWEATTLMDGDSNPVMAFVPGGEGAKAKGGGKGACYEKRDTGT